MSLRGLRGESVFINRQINLLLRVAKVDVFDSRQGSVLLVVGIKFGEFVVVGAFEMPLPCSQFRSPDDLCAVFCVKGDVWFAFVFPAIEISDVDSVDVVKQRLIGCLQRYPYARAD